MKLNLLKKLRYLCIAISIVALVPIGIKYSIDFYHIKKFEESNGRNVVLYQKLLNRKGVVLLSSNPQVNINAVKVLSKDGRIKYLFICLPIVLIGLFGALYFKMEENKTDPIKKLKVLKSKSIINENEYEIKVNKVHLTNKEQNESKLKKKEFDKLINDLRDLKSKGIISEKEFEEKSSLIQSMYQ